MCYVFTRRLFLWLYNTSVLAVPPHLPYPTNAFAAAVPDKATNALSLPFPPYCKE
jgi:hypothetical protein